MRKLYSVAAGVFVAALAASAALADGPDISARRLLASWHDEDPGMRMVAEVIASAFASGFSWGGDTGGKRASCAPPDLKGGQIMNAFEHGCNLDPDQWIQIGYVRARNLASRPATVRTFQQHIHCRLKAAEVREMITQLIQVGQLQQQPDGTLVLVINPSEEE